MEKENVFKRTKIGNICKGNFKILVPKFLCSNPCAFPLKSQNQGAECVDPGVASFKCSSGDFDALPYLEPLA